MRIAIVLVLLTLLVGCQSEKKPVNTDAMTEMDYKEALDNFKIGCNYLNRNDSAQAIHYLELACQGDDKNYRYHHWLGFAYMINGQMEQAESQFKRALDINDEHSDTYNDLATLYMETGRYDQALEALRKVLSDKTYQQPQLAYFNLGLCYRALDQPDQAVAAFQQAVAQDPEFFRAFLQIGQIYKEKQDYEKALNFFLKAEEGFANDAAVLFEIGHAYFQLSRFLKANKYLAQVSILFPPPDIDKPTQEMLRIIGQKLE